MVILRVSPGMANSMYEYATAYNLAKELNTELAIDVSEHDISIWPYMLDYFQIPETRKVQYPVVLSQRNHGKVEGIKNYFCDAPIILVEDVKGVVGNIIEYKNITDVICNKIPLNKDLYLNGYFFGKDYNGKYWSDVVKQFEAREEFYEINVFEQVACKKDVVPIGIHIRRGDMLFAPWAQKMSDEYYCAGIAWFRKHIKGCEFFVFTDDKQYVRELFGEQKDVHYVNILGFDEADIIEFICLSKCKHFILSNSSTYSRLASEICVNENKIIIRKKGVSKLRKNEGIHRLYHRMNLLKKKKREIEFNDSDISHYFRVYCKQLPKYRTILEDLKINGKDDGMKPDGVLNAIAYHSILRGFRDDVERVMTLKSKMLALYDLKRYDRFVELSYVVYSDYANHNWFRKRLINALTEEGYNEEAELESKWKTDRNTIVYIFGSNQENIISINTMEMQYADIFGHMGYESHYIIRTDDKTSLIYVNKSQGKKYTNAAGVKSMYFAHDVGSFLLNDDRFHDGKERIAIVRTIDDYKAARGMKRVFVDYSDPNDYLHDIGEKMSEDDLKWMYDNVEYIMSSDNSVLREYSEKTIKMRVLTPFIEERNYYRWGQSHRMKPEFIYNVSAIVEKICV